MSNIPYLEGDDFFWVQSLRLTLERGIWFESFLSDFERHFNCRLFGLLSDNAEKIRITKCLHLMLLQHLLMVTLWGVLEQYALMCKAHKIIIKFRTAISMTHILIIFKLEKCICCLLFVIQIYFNLISISIFYPSSNPHTQTGQRRS